MAVADELGMQAEKGVILQRLGGMFVTCYAVRRTDANYEADFRNWVRRAGSRGDPELARITGLAAGAADYRWPSALEAMDLAEHYLRRGPALVRSNREGTVLKGIADVLTWRPVVGGTADPDELIRVCELALKALPGGRRGQPVGGQADVDGAAGSAGPPCQVAQARPLLTATVRRSSPGWKMTGPRIRRIHAAPGVGCAHAGCCAAYRQRSDPGLAAARTPPGRDQPLG